MSYNTIQLAYDGGVATITLNRPEKRNAISFELIDDLLRALDEVAKSDAIVVIVTGAGKAFCSGMDLDNLKALLGRSPEQNVKDLAEIPDNVKNKLEIVPVRWIDKVLEIALERAPVPLTDEEAAIAAAAAAEAAASADKSTNVVKH